MIRVPGHLQELAKVHALKTWANGPACPKDIWFTSINRAFKLIGSHPPKPDEEDDDGDPMPRRWELVAAVLALVIKDEGALATHVQTTNQGGFATEAEWQAICEAAAWRLLQRYNLAVKKGDWNPDDE
jgi:hypothetical protein